MYAQCETIKLLLKSLPSFLDLYYEAFPNDRVYTKSLVYGVYTVELVQSILVTHDAFAIFGDGFGNLSALTVTHFDWLTVPIMSGFGTCLSSSLSQR
jgi:hypothetical protein